MIELTNVTKRYGAAVAVAVAVGVGVLGVLVVTSEYATGQIRATFGATPQRLPVLAAKATTFVGVLLAYGLITLAIGGAALVRRDA